MRNSRFIASFVFSSFLVLILVINTFAVPVTEELFIYGSSIYYRPNSSEGSGVYDFIDPVYNSNNVTFSLPNEFGLNHKLVSIGVLMYPNNDGIVELQRGYIYTFKFNFRMNKIEIEPDDFVVTFGVCNSDMSLSRPIGDVVYTVTKSGTSYNYDATIVIDVKEDFDFSHLGIENDLSYYLEIIGSWTGDLTLRHYSQSVTKSVGEEAYYEASLDAIKGLPQTEYDFIYNSMPDETGEVETIKGQFIEVLAVFNPDLEALAQALTTDVARPCVYLPSVVIPFMDIEVWDNQIFYVDSYLNKMNPNIMSALESMLFFVRTVALFTFITVGLYKMIRMEWWT